MSTRFSMSFNNRDNDTGDDIENIDMSFENPKSSAEVARMIQKFLVAAGYANIEAVVNIARDDYYGSIPGYEEGAYVIDEGGPVFGVSINNGDRENGDYYPGRC